MYCDCQHILTNLIFDVPVHFLMVSKGCIYAAQRKKAKHWHQGQETATYITYIHVTTDMLLK